VLQASSPRMTDEYKVYYLKRAAANYSWPPTERVEETSRWPEVFPPFAFPTSRIDASAILLAPGERVLVERTENPGSLATRYDVIDQENGLVGWIELPPAERVIGFGAGHIYVARTTEAGWQQLLRHPIAALK
jgi:hypothetical protein